MGSVGWIVTDWLKGEGWGVGGWGWAGRVGVQWGGQQEWRCMTMMEYEALRPAGRSGLLGVEGAIQGRERRILWQPSSLEPRTIA